MKEQIKQRPIRILIAKVGLDGHDRGAKVLARALMEEGFEVIYTGIRKTAGQVAKIALEEDVDVVGLSSLSGAHMRTFIEVIDALKRHDLTDILVIGGGIIPVDDAEALREKGVAAIFSPGTTISDIVTLIRKEVRR